MATSRQLTPAQRSAVSSLIGTQIDVFLAVVVLETDRELNPPTLRESFPLYVTSIEELRAAHHSGRLIATASHDSGTWHHQIAMGDQIRAFAVTTLGKDNLAEGRLLSLMNGVLCTHLAEAIRETDMKFNDDYFVTLVRVIDANLYFFLIARGLEEEVLIVSSLYAPEVLMPLTILSAREFGEKLHTLPRVVGIRFKAD
jgi:hypothetical protein